MKWFYIAAGLVFAGAVLRLGALIFAGAIRFWWLVLIAGFIVFLSLRVKAYRKKKKKEKLSREEEARALIARAEAGDAAFQDFMINGFNAAIFKEHEEKLFHPSVDK